LNSHKEKENEKGFNREGTPNFTKC